MAKMSLICLPLTFFLLTVSAAQGQQADKVYRVGYLGGTSGEGSHERAFQQAMHELGYVERKNLVIEWRPVGGQRDRLPVLAAELVRLKVDSLSL
jgi:putative tryptophan/tyrosine transport system substrate-binding protein